VSELAQRVHTGPWTTRTILKNGLVDREISSRLDMKVCLLNKKTIGILVLSGLLSSIAGCGGADPAPAAAPVAGAPGTAKSTLTSTIYPAGTTANPALFGTWNTALTTSAGVTSYTQAQITTSQFKLTKYCTVNSMPVVNYVYSPILQVTGDTIYVASTASYGVGGPCPVSISSNIIKYAIPSTLSLTFQGTADPVLTLTKQP
jgi:hypothetical protein